ncbi:CGNR zinc finger domain-containing protein [Fodinicola acaciae]|uniref:CGNR zinc finger domain-containing protein n=1 Tax=Fodinicola acaciae TaxID=2681555 RepID=UPI0013CF5334|nr:CGNR zinc finger domain-containing protein [Fodinicola acaciae]
MDVREFAETGLVALDLVNTWDVYEPDPERLTNNVELRRFCRELGEPSVVSAGDLEAVRALRDRLRPAVIGSAEERTAALVRLSSGLPHAAVVAGDDVPRLELVATSEDLAARLGVRALRELLEIAAAGDWDRVHHCAAAPCEDVFLDRSRPGRRQFCSTRCANRAHAVVSRARRS